MGSSRGRPRSRPANEPTVPSSPRPRELRAGNCSPQNCPVQTRSVSAGPEGPTTPRTTDQCSASTALIEERQSSGAERLTVLGIQEAVTVGRPLELDQLLGLRGRGLEVVADPDEPLLVGHGDDEQRPALEGLGVVDAAGQRAILPATGASAAAVAATTAAAPVLAPTRTTVATARSSRRYRMASRTDAARSAGSSPIASASCPVDALDPARGRQLPRSRGPARRRSRHCRRPSPGSSPRWAPRRRRPRVRSASRPSLWRRRPSRLARSWSPLRWWSGRPGRPRHRSPP